MTKAKALASENKNWRKTQEYDHGLSAQVVRTIELLKLDMRPSTVRAVCGLPKPAVRNLYIEIHNRPPAGGLHPHDPYWSIKTPVNCLHSSLFYNIYRKIITASGVGKTDAFITAFKLYKQTAGGDEILTVNRAWFLTQQISRHEMEGVGCKRCSILFIAMKSYPPAYKLCPLCDVTTDSMNRHTWVSEHKARVRFSADKAVHACSA